MATHDSLGISGPEFSIIVFLAEHNDVSSRDINKTTGMDKATITRALDRLTNKSLISRTKSKTVCRGEAYAGSGTCDNYCLVAYIHLFNQANSNKLFYL